MAVAALTTLSPAAFAEDVSFGPSQLCGLQTARPDTNHAVQVRTVQGRNGPIDYARFGHGTPLLLITGYRATLGEWNAYFLGELVKHHEVIIFDNRGIGRSAIVEGRYGPDYGMRDMAADAADVIAGLKLSRVDVVDWSMGGMIAQQLALDARARVSSLTLIATAPLSPQVQAVYRVPARTRSAGSWPCCFPSMRRRMRRSASQATCSRRAATREDPCPTRSPRSRTGR
ncbi:alpha/beta hydrolase fold [Candidatus Paraburkholderia kirkii]|nr:alpha/beta hydrolase fold [Candidatus Paraburkholderia kirkii]